MEHLIYKSHNMADNHNIRELLIDINDLKRGYLCVMEERNVSNRKLNDYLKENAKLYEEIEQLKKTIEDYKNFNTNIKNRLKSNLTLKERLFGKIFM